MGPYEVLPLGIRLDLRVIKMKRFALPQSLEQEPHHHMQFSIISIMSYLSAKGYDNYILDDRTIELYDIYIYIYIYIYTIW